MIYPIFYYFILFLSQVWELEVCGEGDEADDFAAEADAALAAIGQDGDREQAQEGEHDPMEVNPQPSTLDPQSSTPSHQTSSLNLQSSTLNPQSSAPNPQPSTLRPQP